VKELHVFGPHLIIDGSRSDTQKLADRILVEQILNDYPAAIGMTKIGGPYMFEYQAPDPAYSGVSGLVVIAESHIAIHTFPVLDYFTLDIFSCKNFDHEKAIAYIKAAFNVQEMDRMLVQRGLSFRGPHHGRLGATDELIAAAEQRLASGVTGVEPALPDEPASGVEGARMLGERTALAVRHAADGPAATGGMIWPQYGITPDFGTYGEHAEIQSRKVRNGARVRTIHGSRTSPRSTVQPVLVNPTASISGLLDKMSASSGTGRDAGRALAEWERWARDSQCAIALTLSAPVIAAGMRELLVYSVERRYVDVVVASADDLFNDCYQALGFEHDLDSGCPRAMAEGLKAAHELLLRCIAEAPAGEIVTPSTLWRALGAALPAWTPRKGLLQAAASVGTPIFSPDLAGSALGDVLLTTRARGIELPLDTTEDLLALGKLLAIRPRLGTIRVAMGAANALLDQARGVLPLIEAPAPALVGTIQIDARGSGAVPDENVIAVAADASLALPLLVTGLAQRFPHVRQPLVPAEQARQTEEPALA
jgi:S-adenosylmethionine decarboxylase